MVAVQCVFCVFWQDIDINCTSDAMRVFYGRTVILKVAMQCVFCAFWQDSDINGSDAVRVLCILAGHRCQLRCSACFYGRTTISIVAMQCEFFMAGQRYKL